MSSATRLSRNRRRWSWGKQFRDGRPNFGGLCGRTAASGIANLWTLWPIGGANPKSDGGNEAELHPPYPTAFSLTLPRPCSAIQSSTTGAIVSRHFEPLKMP